eukprot:412905-Pelagomonas_calceolata.AAC.1
MDEGDVCVQDKKSLPDEHADEGFQEEQSGILFIRVEALEGSLRQNIQNGSARILQQLLSQISSSLLYGRLTLSCSGHSTIAPSCMAG